MVKTGDGYLFMVAKGGRKGHQLGFGYHLLKDVETRLTYYISERHDRPGQKGGDLNVLHADVIFKF